MRGFEGKIVEKSRRTAERMLLAVALLCGGSNGLKSAEIPPGASWERGIEQLYVDSTEETGGIYVCAKSADGVNRDQWVLSVPGTPMDDYRPGDVEEWVNKVRRNGESVDCYVDAHNHPPALQKKMYGDRLRDPKSMPPGTGDLWSIYKKSVDTKNLGVMNTYAIVVDGLGVWSFAPTPEIGEFQVKMLEHLHNVERDQWSPEVGRGVSGWLTEVEGKTIADVPELLKSQAYKNLQAAYRQVGFAISYQSLDEAKQNSPRAYMR